MEDGFELRQFADLYINIFQRRTIRDVGRHLPKNFELHITAKSSPPLSLWTRLSKKKKADKMVFFPSCLLRRSRADSNCCRSFCRALPSHSATRPSHPIGLSPIPAPKNRFFWVAAKLRYFCLSPKKNWTFYAANP
jgi:hypothetical protein